MSHDPTSCADATPKSYIRGVLVFYDFARLTVKSASGEQVSFRNATTAFIVGPPNVQEHVYVAYVECGRERVAVNLSRVPDIDVGPRHPPRGPISRETGGEARLESPLPTDLGHRIAERVGRVTPWEDTPEARMEYGLEHTGGGGPGPPPTVARVMNIKQMNALEFQVALILSQKTAPSAIDLLIDPLTDVQGRIRTGVVVEIFGLQMIEAGAGGPASKSRLYHADKVSVGKSE